MITGKRILITGMAGSIGSELAKQLSKNNKIFGIDQDENGLFCLTQELKDLGYWVYSRTGDIRDTETIRDIFEDFKPQIVFHAAALKHVTPNEFYPLEAIKTNILGTYNVIFEAKRWECLEKVVFISTDKVVNAHCIMGITKLCAEGLIRRAGEKFVSVRFGNVINSQGSVLKIWERQVRNGEPITITDKRMERYMMTIPDACSLVIKAATSGDHGDVYILDMGKPKKIIDLKEEIYPDYPIKEVGLRKGETLSERLMTDEEEIRAERKDNFWVVKSP